METGTLTAFQPDVWQCECIEIGDGRPYHWSWRALSYPFWRIYWNADPGAWVSFRGVDYRLDPDQIVVVTPRTAVDHHAQGTISHTYLHANLGYPYDRVKPSVHTVPASSCPMPLRECLLESARQRSSVGREDFSRTLAAHGFACSVLCALPPDIWPRLAAHPTIRELVDSIVRQPEGAHRTDAMAQQCGVSVNTFLRRFRDQVGCSPRQFVIHSRLQKACSLLDQSKHSIDEIAAACGFCDRYHFSKIFRTHFNCGPATFRREHPPRS